MAGARLPAIASTNAARVSARAGTASRRRSAHQPANTARSALRARWVLSLTVPRAASAHARRAASAADWGCAPNVAGAREGVSGTIGELLGRVPAGPFPGSR